MVSYLIQHAAELGYGLTFGDAYRDGRAFKGTEPYGAEFSNHKKRLAVDFNIFKDGSYLLGKEADEGHNLLHDYWDEIGGGERITWDLNHYEYTGPEEG